VPEWTAGVRWIKGSTCTNAWDFFLDAIARSFSLRLKDTLGQVSHAPNRDRRRFIFLFFLLLDHTFFYASDLATTKIAALHAA
jgi:hypothetical protein